MKKETASDLQNEKNGKDDANMIKTKISAMLHQIGRVRAIGTNKGLKGNLTQPLSSQPI
ncbi:MAG TPA: hypothetical protein VK907_00110 [Phnomibacter sp.]|nr:hypothetical protein [Phnomibacter sp.]